MYNLGQGIEVDAAQSLYWYQKAADQGRLIAQEILSYGRLQQEVNPNGK